MIILNGLEANLPSLLDKEPAITLDSKKLVVGLEIEPGTTVNINLSRLISQAEASADEVTVRRIHSAVLSSLIQYQSTSSGIGRKHIVSDTYRPYLENSRSIDLNNTVFEIMGDGYENAFSTDIEKVDSEIRPQFGLSARSQRSNTNGSQYDSYGRNVNFIALASLYPIDPQEGYKEVEGATVDKSSGTSLVSVTSDSFPDIQENDVIYFGGMPGTPDAGQSSTHRGVVQSVDSGSSEITIDNSAASFTDAVMYLARPQRLKTLQECVADISSKWPNAENSDVYGEFPLTLLQNQPYKFEIGDTIVVEYTVPISGPFGTDTDLEVEVKTCLMTLEPSPEGRYTARRTGQQWNEDLDGNGTVSSETWYIESFNERRVAYGEPFHELAPRLKPADLGDATLNSNNTDNVIEATAIASAIAGWYVHPKIVEVRPKTLHSKLPIATRSYEVQENSELGDTTVYYNFHYVADYKPWHRYDPNHPMYPDTTRGEGLVVDIVQVNDHYIEQVSGFAGFWSDPPPLAADSRFDHDAGKINTGEVWRMKSGLANTVHQIAYVEASDTDRNTYESALVARQCPILESSDSSRVNSILNSESVFFVRAFRHFPRQNFVQGRVKANAIAPSDLRTGTSISGVRVTPVFKFVRELTVLKYTEKTQSVDFAENLAESGQEPVYAGDMIIKIDSNLSSTPVAGDRIASTVAKPGVITSIGRFNNNDVWGRCVVLDLDASLKSTGTSVWVVRCSGYVSQVDAIRPGNSGELLVDGGFANPSLNDPFVVAGKPIKATEIQSIHDSSPGDRAQIPVKSKLKIDTAGVVRGLSVGDIHLERQRQRGRYTTPPRKNGMPHGSGTIVVNASRRVVTVETSQFQMRNSNTEAVAIFDLSEYRAGIDLTSNTHFRLIHNGTPTKPLRGIIIRLPRSLNGTDPFKPIVPNGWKISYSLEIKGYQFGWSAAECDAVGYETVKYPLQDFFFAYTMDDGSQHSSSDPDTLDEWARSDFGGVLTPFAPAPFSTSAQTHASAALLRSSAYDASLGLTRGWSRIDWHSFVDSSNNVYLPLWNAEFIMVGGAWLETSRSLAFVDSYNPMSMAGGSNRIGRDPATSALDDLNPIYLYADPYSHELKTIAFCTHMDHPYPGGADEDTISVPDNPLDDEIGSLGTYTKAASIREATTGTMITAGATRDSYLDEFALQYRVAITPYK